MLKQKKLDLIGAVLRIATLASKFVMTLAIAQYMSLADLGNYGLMASATSFSVYLIGLEIHSFVNREGIGGNKEKWGQLLVKQLSFYLITTLVAIPFFFMVSLLGMGDATFLPYFVVITIVEQFSQEAYRTLIALNDQFSAAFCLFIRSGLWAYLVTGALMFGIGNITLTQIYMIWIGFGVVAMLVAYGLIFFKYTNLRALKFDFDLAWAKIAVRHSLIFLIGTLISRLIAVADRFLVNKFDTKENLGIYVFYTSLALSAGALYSFFGAARLYPVLVSSLKQKDFTMFFKHERQLKQTTIWLSLAFAVGIPAFLFVLSKIKPGELFNVVEHAPLLIMIMGAMFLSNYNTTLQYVLYSHKSDKHILQSNILSLCVTLLFIAGTIALKVITFQVVAFAVLLFYLLNTIIKMRFVRHCNTKLQL